MDGAQKQMRTVFDEKDYLPPKSEHVTRLARFPSHPVPLPVHEPRLILLRSAIRNLKVLAL